MDKFSALEEALWKKILVLAESAWSHSIKKPDIDLWLNNFCGRIIEEKKERIIALFWLSNFMYFGSKEVRALLRSLYHDAFVSKLACLADENLPSSSSVEDRRQFVMRELERTRFVSLGNPSESGALLLYFFRQENMLPKDMFLNASDVFSLGRPKSAIPFFIKDRSKISIANENIDNYVFLDDLCGSGDQLLGYSKSTIENIKVLRPNSRAYFFSLFGSKEGLARARNLSRFDACEAIFELDETYKMLGDGSRYLRNLSPVIERDEAISVVKGYGRLLSKDFATGYKDGQLLVGFSHNVPDNCPAIIWFDTVQEAPEDVTLNWVPIFRRYQKIYG